MLARVVLRCAVQPQAAASLHSTVLRRCGATRPLHAFRRVAGPCARSSTCHDHGEIITLGPTYDHRRPFSSSADEARAREGEGTPVAEQPFPAWLAPLKASVAQYPLETMIGFMIMDAGSIGLMFGLLTSMGVEVPVDFGLAFGVSRMLRRPRLPIDASVAAIIAKLYPPLTQVNLLSVFSRHLKRPSGEQEASLGRRALHAVASLVEKYGLALLVSQRMIVGLVSVLSIYTVLHMGVDVQSHLRDVGIHAEALGAVAGKWAASACLAAPFFPVVLFGAGRLGLIFARVRQAVATHFRK